MTRKRLKRWLSILGTATVISGIGNLYQPTVVVGNSMAPTLEPGRVIWIDRTYYANHRPQRGEVVVFKMDGDVFIKRVYRAPGEKLTYIESDGTWLGVLRADQAEAMRAFCSKPNRHFRVRELRIPDESVFVLGDNLFNSEDSRELGPIPIENIIGRAHLESDETVASQYEIRPRKGRHTRVQAQGREAGV